MDCSVKCVQAIAPNQLYGDSESQAGDRFAVFLFLFGWETCIDKFGDRHIRKLNSCIEYYGKQFIVDTACCVN